MINVTLKNNNFRLAKGKYGNGRLAIVLFDDNDNMNSITGTISVNIPEARFMQEMVGDSCSNDVYINHIDGIEYNELIEPLDYYDQYGHTQSGFNTYIAVRFREDKLV